MRPLNVSRSLPVTAPAVDAPGMPFLSMDAPIKVSKMLSLINTLYHSELDDATATLNGTLPRFHQHLVFVDLRGGGHPASSCGRERQRAMKCPILRNTGGTRALPVRVSRRLRMGSGTTAIKAIVLVLLASLAFPFDGAAAGPDQITAATFAEDPPCFLPTDSDYDGISNSLAVSVRVSSSRKEATACWGNWSI